MKQIYFSTVVLLVLLLFVPAVAAAKSANGWGIGIILGEPTGLSFKIWTGRTTAFDAAAAWSFRKEDKLNLHLDYLIHNFNLFKVKQRSGRLPLYYGIGGRIKFQDETRIGVRIPVGICYIFKKDPLDVFLEVVPVLDFVPETEFDINASIGIRYFFKR